MLACGSVDKLEADAGDPSDDAGDPSGDDPTLAVTVTGNGSGQVTSSPAGIQCGDTCSAQFPSGTEVTLVPNPASDSGFDGWGGACSGLGSCVVTLSEDTELEASIRLGGSVKWAQHFGGDLDDESTRMVTDHAGNVILAGHFSGTLNFGGQDLASSNDVTANPSGDIFVAKFDPLGNHIWSVRYGGQGNEELWALDVFSDNSVAIAGWYRDDVTFGDDTVLHQAAEDTFVARLAAGTGAATWAKGYSGSSNVKTYTLAVTSDDDIVMSFFFKGTANFGDVGDETTSGGDDFVLARYDGGTGAHIWSDPYGSAAGDDQVLGVSVDADDNIYLSGYFFGTMNLGGSNLGQVGTGRDLFLARFDENGAHSWSRPYGSTADIFTGSNIIDDSGDLIVRGSFTGTASVGGSDMTSVDSSDMFVAKFKSEDGSHDWSVHFSGSEFKGTRDLALLPGGDVAVIGFFSDDVSFDGATLTNDARHNTFLARLGGSDGKIRWLRSYGDDGGQGDIVGRAVATDDSGALFATATFVDNAMLGSGNAFSSKTAESDIVLVRVVP